MASSNSFFTFIAGAITGAALLLLANTDKGVEVIKDLKEKGTEALDKLEDALKSSQEEQQTAENAEEEETE